MANKEAQVILRHLFIALAFASVAALSGCPDEEITTTPGAFTVPDDYDFTSNFVDGESSVAYSGQTARQVLIADLNSRISGLTEAVDGPNWSLATAADVYSYLDYFVSFDSDSNGADAIALSTTPAVATEHQSYASISSGKDLVGKLAGNDDKTDHKDWDGGGFAGWSDATIATNGGSITSPQGLLEAFLHTLASRAVARADGTLDTSPDGATLPVHVTPEGLDLKQLTQKFLLMAVNYSQACDDYMDSDVDGKGLLASNEQVEGKPYSALEHQWDEGFGYFGAARNYGDYSDAEIAGSGGREDWWGYNDSDGDGAISLTSEFNFGASTNAAKRDLGAADSSAPTDFTKDAWDGFRQGRAIIAAAKGQPLTADQMVQLEAARDKALDAYEGAIAATALHYINDTLADIASIGGGFDFLDYAKHWSELKGFSIGLQFNPRSKLTDAQFSEFHQLIGDRPVDPTADAADIEAYVADLVAARDILMTAYAFPADLKGDDAGAGGW